MFKESNHTCKPIVFQQNSFRRYGFELDCVAGRACDINRNSRQPLRLHNVSIFHVFSFFSTLGFKWHVLRAERFLKKHFPDRCIFSDILNFTTNPAVTLSKMKLVSRTDLQDDFLCFLTKPRSPKLTWHSFKIFVFMALLHLPNFHHHSYRQTLNSG